MPHVVGHPVHHWVVQGHVRQVLEELFFFDHAALYFIIGLLDCVLLDGVVGEVDVAVALVDAVDVDLLGLAAQPQVVVFVPVDGDGFGADEEHPDPEVEFALFVQEWSFDLFLHDLVFATCFHYFEDIVELSGDFYSQASRFSAWF